MTGRVNTNKVLRADGTTEITRTDITNTYSVLDGTANNQRYFPYVPKQTELVNEAVGAANLITTTETSVLDANIDFATGNVKVVSTTITRSDSKVWSSSVATDFITSPSGCLSLPQVMLITRTLT